jgi:hypothetical protein
MKPYWQGGQLAGDAVPNGGPMFAADYIFDLGMVYFRHADGGIAWGGLFQDLNHGGGPGFIPQPGPEGLTVKDGWRGAVFFSNCFAVLLCAAIACATVGTRADGFNMPRNCRIFSAVTGRSRMLSGVASTIARVPVSM